ncbi:SdpI family protein [Faecalibaculum rodentium]|uniref:SdpI family protein n=1 Tax=Faecalibaculum rodentium TaxID=1702221 RepID=UPI0023F51AEF|nr:SdpI family protein [Faecalibaculum rodentium]
MKQQLLRYRKELAAETLVLLLPCLAGLVLPASSSDFLRLEWQWLLPAFNVAVFWGTFLFCAAVPTFRSVSRKTVTFLFRLLTVSETAVCLIMMTLDYGSSFSVVTLINGMTALLFLIIGNILPKIGPNSVIGIRTSWALQSEEAWNYTQRRGGRLMVLASLVMLLCCFMPGWQPMALYWSALLAAVLGSVWISWKYARDHPAAAGKSLQTAQEKKAGKTASIVTVVLLLTVALGIGALLALSDYQVVFRQDRLVLDANTAPDTSIKYAQIQSIQLVDADDPQAAAGSKVIGYNGFGLEMGTFDNSLFGQYSRYVREGGPVIVVKTGSQTVVFDGKDPQETRRLYKELLHRAGLDASPAGD